MKNELASSSNAATCLEEVNRCTRVITVYQPLGNVNPLLLIIISLAEKVIQTGERVLFNSVFRFALAHVRYLLQCYDSQL